MSKLEHGNHSTSAHEEIVFRTLIIEPTDKDRDTGLYRCKIIDMHDQEFSSSKEVEILSDHFINLSEDLGKTSVSIAHNKQAARINIKYSAIPLPKFKWFNNRNQLIFNHDMVLYKDKYTVEIKDKSIVLTVRKPTINDFGDYTLFADNGLGNSSFSIKLFVAGECILFESKFQ